LLTGEGHQRTHNSREGEKEYGKKSKLTARRGSEGGGGQNSLDAALENSISKNLVKISNKGGRPKETSEAHR